MRRSSKIILAISAFLLVYFLMVYAQLAGQSRKEFKQQDATAFLNELGEAFKRSDTSAVVSFAWPDATVAGQQLRDISSLLHNYFQQAKDPKVTYGNVRLVNEREDIANVETTVTVNDGNETRYSSQAVFRLERRAVPHLSGLVTVYDWKVVNVAAQAPPGI